MEWTRLISTCDMLGFGNGDTTDDDLCLDEFGCVEFGHVCTRPNEEWDRSYDTSPGQAGVVIEPPSPP